MKLTVISRKPKRGFTHFEAEATQKLEPGEPRADPETEAKALQLVNDTICEMLFKLKDLGYDYTDARFSIRKILQ